MPFRTKGHGKRRHVYMLRSRHVHPSREAVHQARANKTQYRVMYVDTMPWPSYLGMNYYAAKDLGLQYHYPHNTFVIRKDLDRATKLRVIAHEKAEVKLMKSGLSYGRAHAQVNERLGAIEAW